MEQVRKPFQGVLNILSFNRHFYVFGLGVMIAIIASQGFVMWDPALFYLVVVSFTYGLVAPLIVSAYVYDFSNYYSLDWLKDQIQNPAKAARILNINAGFDETSFILQRKFPAAELQVFDFYNAKQHTEQAIIRARKVSLVFPQTKQITTGQIPLPDNSTDIVFLLSAAHEIRSQDEKIVFLKECQRVCKADGKVIMVEHLRDLPNFIAFTIGFTHFFSRSTWKKAFNAAGFCTFKETKFISFMSIFTCTP